MIDHAVAIAHLEVLTLNKRLAKLSAKGGRFKTLHEDYLPTLRKLSRRLIPKLPR